MKNDSKIKNGAMVLVVSSLGLVMAAGAPLKVYILSGQSNMEGHAQVTTFDAIGLDPKTAPMLKEMTDGNGKPVVLDDVWISYLHSQRGAEGHVVKSGKLTTGYGAQNGEKIGPEFTFGIHMDKALDEPILIIKTAWGGKSLHTDFRPPGAGPYELTEADKERIKSRGNDVGEEVKKREEASGVYYRAMIDHVKAVLADPGTVVEGYDKSEGYELSGFVWFQGWNDMVDSGVYPKRGEAGGYDEYSKLFAMFIKEVRKDLDAPDLPFVIGVLGVGGPVDPEDKRAATRKHFQDAMAAPAAMPEFKNTVAAVWTDQYWDKELEELDSRMGKVKSKVEELAGDRKLKHDERMEITEKVMAEIYTEEEREKLKGKSNQGYHYLGSAKILGQIGKAFAEAMLELEKK